MIRNVIFDLDGTLADTSPGIIESVQYTVSVMGWQPLTREQLLSFIGPPLRKSFMDCCGCSEAEAQQAVTVFRTYYQAGAVLHAAPYPGMEVLCAQLRAQGFGLAVATNKPQRFADALVQHFGLAEYLHPVCGADEAGKLKKADLIRLSAEGLHAELSETVLVGDTENDAEGAAAAGVQFLAVTYGFGFRSTADVQACTPIGTADSPRAIADILIRTEGSPT